MILILSYPRAALIAKLRKENDGFRQELEDCKVDLNTASVYIHSVFMDLHAFIQHSCIYIYSLNTYPYIYMYIFVAVLWKDAPNWAFYPYIHYK